MTEDADGMGESGPELLVEEDGPVRVVVLNRPDAFNAANEALHGRIAEIWSELDADPSVGAIVLTGAGQAFSGEATSTSSSAWSATSSCARRSWKRA